MALTEGQSKLLESTLTAEFKSVATFQSSTSLNLDGYKVIVSYSARETSESELKAIQMRAREIAGRALTRDEVEFQSGAGALTR